MDPDAGSIRLDGRDWAGMKQRELRPLRQGMQMVFQDSLGSLDPRQTVGTLLSTPLKVHGVRGREVRRQRVLDIVARVGLPEAALARYPHEFSGGQRQRIKKALSYVPKAFIK